MHDVVIIGGGLFGSIVGTLLSKTMNVVAIDNEEKLAGSKPAACLMKPSWYSSLGPEFYKPSLQTLESLYNVKTLTFDTGIKEVDVKWINPKEILATKAVIQIATVVSISPLGNIWQVATANHTYQCKYVIVAAGIWSNDVIRKTFIKSGMMRKIVPDLFPQSGVAFIGKGSITNKIKLWRPYRQLVRFNIAYDKIWAGDGTALKSIELADLEKSAERCAEFTGLLTSQMTPLLGHRPYVKKVKPCYLEEHAPNYWVCTGGAKNGTIAAGWAAYELQRTLT